MQMLRGLDISDLTDYLLLVILISIAFIIIFASSGMMPQPETDRCPCSEYCKAKGMRSLGLFAMGTECRCTSDGTFYQVSCNVVRDYFKNKTHEKD